MTHNEFPDGSLATPGRPELSLRLTSPADVLSAIPYLLRFHPEESIVFLVLSHKRLVVTARVDLTPQSDAGALGAYFESVTQDNAGDTLVIVAYCSDVERAGVFVDQLVEAMGNFDIADALVADGSQWWSRLCEGDCCSSGGTPYDPTTSVIAARAVAAGLPVMASRAELADSVAGPAFDAMADATDAFEEALIAVTALSGDERRSRISLMVEEFCVHRRPLTPRECAELAVLAYEIELRDSAALRIGVEDAQDHVALWHQVVARTVSPFELAPLCLLGLAAWVAGNGALQVVCMERAERLNPDYSLLGVLEEINARGLPPSAWQGMRAA